jgi:large subunit ribosomal protein L5
MANSLRTKFKKEVVTALKSELGLKNIHQVPVPKKVTVNVGLGKGLKDAKFAEVVEANLKRITGQKPVSTKARKSVSGFKIREGMVVGMVVTLRGNRMWDFINKLVNVSFPRVRDFRGISTSTVDHKGNISIGFKEHTAFPEIRSDEIETLHGLQVTITTNSDDKKHGLALFKALGFPFNDNK